MFLSRPKRDQVLALAGVFQACQLVDDLARLGTCDSSAFEASIHSLFEQNPSSTEAVFGGPGRLEHGVTAIAKILGDTGSRRKPETLRYVLGVLYLQKKLSADKKMLDQVGQGIEQASRQAEHFDETHPNVLANIADLYQRTLSTLNFRIQVGGMPEHLRQTAIANKIRCLLLAGIRAAILWQQTGGKRRHLILHRSQILELARDIGRAAA